MTTTQDRIDGLIGELGVKAPVLVATTTAITLYGLQTIDGVVLAAEDRVLVKDQADAAGNGIYVVQATIWLRSPDFDGARDCLQGTLVPVATGTVNARTLWMLTTVAPVIGTSNMTFAAFTPLTASAYIQTLLDDADAAAARTTLGLGTAAVQNTGTSIGNVLALANVGNTTPGLASLVVGTNGDLNPATLGAALSVASADSSAGGDWIAWFRRQGNDVNNESLVRLEHFSAGYAPLPIFTGIANRGTIAAPLPVLANDHLLVLDGRGRDGTAVNYTEYEVGITDTQAQIAFRAAENWGGAAHGTYITFSNTTLGALSPSEALRIDSGQRILVGHTLTSGIGQGDIALKNDRALRFVNAAGTASIKGIQVDTSNNVSVGSAANALLISGSGLGTNQAISAGAADSAGAGFRTLRIPN